MQVVIKVLQSTFFVGKFI